MTRRGTPASSQLLGRRHREQERDSWDDERESFPQFWYVGESLLVRTSSRIALFRAGNVVCVLSALSLDANLDCSL